MVLIIFSKVDRKIETDTNDNVDSVQVGKTKSSIFDRTGLENQQRDSSRDVIIYSVKDTNFPYKR